jgi:Bacteriocin-protection, YdeI or OmpD-Associated/Domain of unknown function (DUF1905)
MPAIKNSFNAKIQIIGVNPYVLLPDTVLKNIFKTAGKDKSPVPVKGLIEGNAYKQTLVKFSGKWRLYINGPMLKASKKSVGDLINLTIAFDPAERKETIHPTLAKALNENAIAKKVFESLTPSRQKEIIRYINFLDQKKQLTGMWKRPLNF